MKLVLTLIFELGGQFETSINIIHFLYYQHISSALQLVVYVTLLINSKAKKNNINVTFVNYIYIIY